VVRGKDNSTGVALVKSSICITGPAQGRVCATAKHHTFLRTHTLVVFLDRMRLRVLMRLLFD